MTNPLDYGAGLSYNRGMDTAEANAAAQEGCLHPVNQVWFRAGLLACREYMARFVEQQGLETATCSEIAASIRANWWPRLGQDFGPPRKLDFKEITDGDTPGFRCKTAAEVSPTQEALPIALAFLDGGDVPVESVACGRELNVDSGRSE